MALLSKQLVGLRDNWPLSWSTSIRLAGLGALGLALIYLGKIWYSYKTFKRMGIKTPKYRFIFGNLSEILEKTQSECLREWTQQLGKTYGYYEGHLPILVTSDTDIIQEVFIKQFSNFIARKQYPFQFADDDPRMDLFLSTNKRWKRMRNIINPTFSPAKLKELAPIMQRSTERFIQILEKHENEEIAISEFLDRYTMDTIWNSAVGMDIDVQSNPDNIYMKKALHVFKDLVELKFSFRLTSYFHEFRPYILGLVSLNSWLLSKFQSKLDDMADPLFWLTQNIHNIIQDRQKNTITRKDFTQLLMEAKIDDHELLRKKEKVELSKFRLDKEMSFDEIKFNLVGFLLAGFETTSTSLNYCFYILAHHPHEQQKLQQELDSFFPADSDVVPNFDNIGELEYLDWFIKEALRMYPISSNTVNRRCMFPTNLKGIQMEPGVSVTVDVLSLHYDPEIWGPTDPNEFNPSRFSPEFKRNANAYLPFGIGPRNCVGMRYALIEMKLALSKVLLKFNVHATPNTPLTLQYIEGTVRRPKNKIYIKLEKRSDSSF